MLDKRLREAWHARERDVPISAELNFTRDGLVLGAGTVIVSADGPRLLKSLDGEEARVLALLSAAYGKAVPPSVLGNIRRAVEAWRTGDDCLAYVHLAHARLGELTHPRDAAQRLVIVDAFLNAGGGPRTIFQALKVGRSYIDALEKDYNPNEPRVPAGSGRTSGEWTRDGGASSPSRLSFLASGAASRIGGQWTRLLSWIAELDAAQLAALGLYAARVLTPVGGAAAVFGLLFIPSPNDVRVEGEVAGIPGLRYSWNRDEAVLHLTYDGAGGVQRTFEAQVDGNVLRDARGRVIGRVLSGRAVAIDAAAVSPDLVDDGEPRFCPDPSKDRRTNDKGLGYENYIKSIVNPGNPTPPYIGYMLSNAVRPVSFDDCEHSTGTMVEIKDGYADFLETDWGKALVTQSFLNQAMDQIEAAGTRPVRWYFSQKQVADFAKGLFEIADEGRRNIQVIFEPWPGRKK